MNLTIAIGQSEECIQTTISTPVIELTAHQFR